MRFVGWRGGVLSSVVGISAMDGPPSFTTATAKTSGRSSFSFLRSRCQRGFAMDRHNKEEMLFLVSAFNYLRATNLEVGLRLNYGPRPTFKRYLCTNDRKLGFDLREGTVQPFMPAQVTG